MVVDEKAADKIEEKKTNGSPTPEEEKK